jgi:hypothetical protein
MPAVPGNDWSVSFSRFHCAFRYNRRFRRKIENLTSGLNFCKGLILLNWHDRVSEASNLVQSQSTKENFFMASAQQMSHDVPLQKLFDTLTQRGSQQSQLSDLEVRHYLADLLVKFVNIENVLPPQDEPGCNLQYIADILNKAEDSTAIDKLALYKRVGDYTLFILGLFPESLNHGRHCISLNYYTELGRRCYMTVSGNRFQPEAAPTVFRKLAEQFHKCVHTLNWVRSYIQDPFYQYIFRQFEIV